MKILPLSGIPTTRPVLNENVLRIDILLDVQVHLNGKRQFPGYPHDKRFGEIRDKRRGPCSRLVDVLCYRIPVGIIDIGVDVPCFVIIGVPQEMPDIERPQILCCGSHRVDIGKENEI